MLIEIFVVLILRLFRFLLELIDRRFEHAVGEPTGLLEVLANVLSWVSPGESCCVFVEV